MSIKLSIFPNSDVHPKSKEDKIYNTQYVSFPYEAICVEVFSEKDLIDTVCNNTWSPFRYSKYRREDNFISCDLITFDIDKNMGIDDAERVILKLGLAALCLPTPNHAEGNERFRLIFPTSRTIVDPEEFRSTYAKLAENFPVDPQCKDIARFYYGSTMDDGFWTEGKLLDPVKPTPVNKDSKFEIHSNIEVGDNLADIVEVLYGESRTKIPEQVSFFLENAHTGLSGNWHTSFNSFVFTLSLQMVPFDNIMAVAQKIAPNPLDKSDVYLLNRAYKDGQLKREDYE